jgi:hypothetical protein
MGFGLRVSWAIEQNDALTTAAKHAGLQMGPGGPRLDMVRPYDFAVAGIIAGRRAVEDMETEVQESMKAIGPQTVTLPTGTAFQRYRTYNSVTPAIPNEPIARAHRMVSGAAQRRFGLPLTTSEPYELTLSGSSIDQASWRRSHRAGHPPVGTLALGPCHTSVEAIPPGLSVMRWLTHRTISPR